MDPTSKINQLIRENPVVIFSKSWCGYSKTAKRLLDEHLGKGNYTAVELDRETDGDDMQDALQRMSGQRTVPNIFIGTEHIGGCDNLLALDRSNSLKERLLQATKASAPSEEPSTSKAAETEAGTPSL